MEPSNLDSLHKSFGTQASNFESNKYHLSKKEYVDYAIQKADPKKNDKLLEVAAGTCILGRAFSKYVSQVTCLDATPSMLEIGKSESEKENINNIIFVKGFAENLPFLDNSYDIVISRLAFHHFVNPIPIFAEMKRVLKENGKLILIDMTPRDISLREEIDKIETIRDNSHIRELTLEEMQKLYTDNDLKLEIQESNEIPVELKGWMELTKTPEELRKNLR